MKNFLLVTTGILAFISSMVSAISVRIAPFVFIGLVILKIAGVTTLSWLNVFLIPIAMVLLGIVFFVINIVISAAPFAATK